MDGRHRGLASLPAACLSGTLLLATAWLPAEAKATPLLISEVFYDAVGRDNGKVFVEIAGPAGFDLSGYALEGVNGADGSVGPTVALSGLIPPGGLFVLADDRGDGATDVAVADQVAEFDLQNGPDSVVLRGPQGVVDAVGYGNFGPTDVFAGEGSPAPDAAAGSSLARRFADVDTDDNAADFLVLATPTPGSAQLRPVPEPNAGPLAAAGLAGLAVLGRRRRPSETRALRTARRRGGCAG